MSVVNKFFVQGKASSSSWAAYCLPPRGALPDRDGTVAIMSTENGTASADDKATGATGADAATGSTGADGKAATAGGAGAHVSEPWFGEGRVGREPTE